MTQRTLVGPTKRLAMRRFASRIAQMLLLATAAFFLTAAPAVAQESGGFAPQQWLQSALEWVQGLGPAGAIAFIGIYIVATVAFLPGSILTLGAGVIFGVLLGSLLVFVGATIGATAAFLVGRYLARSWVAKKIEGNEKFKAIDTAVGREGFKIVALTRLSPVFPFNLLNKISNKVSVSSLAHSSSSIPNSASSVVIMAVNLLYES